jgi:hypothetical protein
MRQQSDGIKGTYSSGSSLNWLGSESFVFQKWYLYVLFVRLEETKCLEEISARTNFTISLSWSTFLRDCFGQPSTIPWIENPALYKMYQYILKICRSTSFVSDFSQTRPFNFFHHPISHIYSVAYMAPANWINWIQLRSSSPEQHLFLGHVSGLSVKVQSNVNHVFIDTLW